MNRFSILLLLLLVTLPAKLVASALYHKDESVDLTFRLPDGWCKGAEKAKIGRAAPTYYVDPTGIARLRISVEECPFDDINLLPKALEKAMTNGSLRVKGKPAITRIGSYPCVVLEMKQAKDSLVAPGALFVHFIVEQKEIAFRLVGAGRHFPGLKGQFLQALNKVSIGLLPRYSPPGPVQVIEKHSAIVVAPPRFRPVKKLSGDTVARFVQVEKEQIFDVTWHKRPLIPTSEVADAFLTSMCQSGFTIKARNPCQASLWPAVTAETETVANGAEVTVFFRLLFLPHRVYQIAGTCRRNQADEFRESFYSAARAFRVGGPRYDGEFYHNPSFMTDIGEIRKETIEVSSKIVDSQSEFPLATLGSLLPRDLPPYQKIDIMGYSKNPDHLFFDEWNNQLACFYMEDIGKKARQHVTLRYSVSIQPMTVRVEDNSDLALSPHLEEALTSETRNTPLRHPRVGIFAQKALAGTKLTKVSVVKKLLEEIAKMAPGPAGAQLTKEWGRGALFALAKPAESGPSERVDLLVSMLRERQIPVRRLYGHLLPRPGENGPLIPHVWCEVFLPPAGWVPADPTPLENGELPILGRWSPRYLCLSIEGPGNIEKQGPDACRIWRGHCLPNIDELPVVIEVTRRLSYPSRDSRDGH